MEGEQRGSNQRSPSHSFDHSPNSCFHRPLLLIHSWQSGAVENRCILVSKAAVARAGHLVQMPPRRVQCLCQLSGKDGEELQEVTDGVTGARECRGKRKICHST